MHQVSLDAIRSQIVALIPVYMNVLMMGSMNGWLPNALYFILIGTGVRATSSECAMIASFSELGRIVFAIPAGIMCDKYGRKRMIISAAILHFFAWLGLSLSSSIIGIYIARFTLGIATSLVNSTSLASIGEIASPEIRGQLTSLYQVAMSIGVILPGIIGATFASYEALAWGITFFAVINVVSLYWVTETPSFLVSQCNLKQAKQTLKQIRRGYQEKEIDYEFEKLQRYIDDEKSNKSKQSWISFLNTKAIRKPLITGMLLNFFTVATGGPLYRAYITAICPSNDFVPKKYYPLINQIVSLLIAMSTTLYIDKFPRRTIFLFGTLIMMITNVICAFTNYFYIEQNIHYVFPSAFLLGNILLLVCYSATLQPMNSAVKSELYPQAVKGFCGSLAIIGQASSTIVLYQLYNLLKDFHGYLVYVIFSVNAVILYFTIYFLLPEGQGTSLTDLQMKFKDDDVPCDGINVEKNSHK